MRKTKKLLALMLCASLTITAFTGCGKKSSDTKKKTSETVEVTDPTIKDAASYIDLAEYKTISLDKKEIDKKVQSQIDSVISSNVTYKQIKSGTVKKGDTVNIYYVGKMDGKAFNGGSCTKDTTPDGYDLEIGSNTFINGFESGLIGKKIGDTVDVDVTFPDSYPQNTDLQGKPAVFTVTINYKRGKKITPKFDDAFVKKNLSDYKSVKDYKTKTRESIVKSMAVEKVCDDTKINKYPKDKINAMKTQIKKSIENYLSQNNTTLDDYLQGQNMTEEDYNKQIEKTSKEDVGNQLVYNAIAQAENLKVTDDEYQKELKTYLKNYSCDKESDLNETFSKTYGTTAKAVIYNSLLYNKIADYLVKNVKES